MANSLCDRTSLRHSLRQKRQQLSSTEQNSAANALQQTFLQFESAILKLVSLSEHEPLNIAVYLSNDGEISPAVLCEYFWSLPGKQAIRTYLPVVEGESLVFAHYHLNSVWKKNKFGIDEPIEANPIQGMELDIVLLPLVGFDQAGGRLGMGGGFYDKTFANKQTNQPPILIGLAHDCQQVSQLPIESWDVPLDAIMTATQFFRTS